MEQALTVLIDELAADEELRYAFFRSPRRTLLRADEWGLPLCESEVRDLVALTPAIWEHLAEQLDAQLQQVA